MPRTPIFLVLALSILICAILISGCSGENASVNNSTPTAIATVNPGAPAIIPGHGTGYTVYGRVYLDGNAVTGAQVEAISVDGTYQMSNVTDKNGVYQLVLPDETEFYVITKYQRLQHKLWPVRLTGSSASYNIYMTSTPKSVIMGKGTAHGGPYGYDASKFDFKASGIEVMAVPANASAAIIAKVDGDGSYFLEVEPDVTYRMDMDVMPAVFFQYRNTDRSGGAKGKFGTAAGSLNFMLGADETALIDFEIFLP